MPVSRKRSLSNISTLEVRPTLAGQDPSVSEITVTDAAKAVASSSVEAIASEQELPPGGEHLQTHFYCQNSWGADQSCDNDSGRCHHRCKRVSELEFEKLKATNRIMQAFQKEWDATPAFLVQLCGINFENLYCEVEVIKNEPTKEFGRSVFSHSRSSSQSPEFIDQFLVPMGMPFAVRESRKFGSVYLTPFYTVIPQLVPKVPSVIFSLHRLTLSRVITNKVFRHELAFNSELQIEPPLGMVEASTTSAVWDSLAHEVSGLVTDSSTSAPVTVLPQVLTGLSSLMISVFPGYLYSRIVFHLDATRLTEGDLQTRAQFLKEMIEFLLSMIDACVIPMRKKWVKVTRELLSPDHFSSDRFVAGLKTIAALLNLTKIDQINAQLKDRVPLLLESTTRVERDFYQREVESGRLSNLAFRGWIQNQQTVAGLVVCCPQLIPKGAFMKVVNIESEIEQVLSQITASFLSSYLRRRSRGPVQSIFRLDASRISGLQARFDGTVLECIQVGLYRTEYKSHNRGQVLQLIRSRKLRQSPLYTVYEKRLLAVLAMKIYHILVKLVTGRQLESPDLELFERQTETVAPVLEGIISEISTLLYLHWVGARQFYLTQ